MRGELHAKANFIKTDSIQQSPGGAIVEKRGPGGKTAQDRTLDLANLIEFAVDQSLAQQSDALNKLGGLIDQRAEEIEHESVLERIASFVGGAFVGFFKAVAGLLLIVLVAVLLVLAVVSFVTDDVQATVIISVMVLVSVLLRFVQEYRSAKAAERLKALVSTTATVSTTMAML